MNTHDELAESLQEAKRHLQESGIPVDTGILDYPGFSFEIVEVQPEYDRALVRFGGTIFACTSEALLEISSQLFKTAHEMKHRMHPIDNRQTHEQTFLHAGQVASDAEET